MPRKRLLMMLFLLPLVVLLWLVGWGLYWATKDENSATVAPMEDQILVAIIDEEEAAISTRWN